MANKIHDAFENVKADPALTQSTIRYLEQKRSRQMRFVHLPVYKTLAAVCAMVAILIGIGGYTWMLTPVSYVSIDINPSMELALNRMDRVVSVTSYNRQGAELIQDLRLKGKTYKQAIYMITESGRLQEYLQSEEELVLTLAADSSRTELKTGVEECCSHIGHGSRSVSVDVNIASEAHDNGLSVGKYSAYLQLAQYDDSITIDNCRDMSMAQIHSQILEHEHGSGHGHGSDSQNEQDTQPQAEQQEPEHDTQSQDTQSQDMQSDDTEPQGHRHGRPQGHHGSHE